VLCPAPGYAWVSGDHRRDQDYRVKPLLGRPDPGHQHVVIVEDGGVQLLLPSPGYAWDDPKTLRVKPLPSGTPLPDYPNVVWTGGGAYCRPAPCYAWAAADRDNNHDYRVTPVRGTPCPYHSHVLVREGGHKTSYVPGSSFKQATSLEYDDEDYFMPEAGYTWVAVDPWKDHDFEVRPVPAGTPHPGYPNVVWIGDGSHFRPAPGYTWVSGDPAKKSDFRVKPAHPVGDLSP
jgi:hypothetical protein